MSGLAGRMLKDLLGPVIIHLEDELMKTEEDSKQQEGTRENGAGDIQGAEIPFHAPEGPEGSELASSGATVPDPQTPKKCEMHSAGQLPLRYQNGDGEDKAGLPPTTPWQA